MPTCPACKETVEHAELGVPTRWNAGVAVLKDWRLWAIGFGGGIAGGMLGGALELSFNPGAWVGAPIGIFVGYRLFRMRICPKCKKVAPFDPPVTA